MKQNAPLEKGIIIGGFSFTLMDEDTAKYLAENNEILLPYREVDMPRDIRFNRDRINGQLRQGILQGESIPDIARRLANVTDLTRAAAVRNARTMCTSAENKGRVDGAARAEAMGIVQKKRWIAIIDVKTRDWHRELDGVTVEPNEMFENSIGAIEYPGDYSADPANVWNCRCCVAYDAVGFRGADGKTEYVDGHEETPLTEEQESDTIKGQRASTIDERGVKHYAHKVGTIDFNDKNAVNQLIKKYEQKYINADVEHCLMICPNGNVYSARGSEWGVNTIDMLGDKINGCITTHNHPRSTTQFSFSEYDFEAALTCHSPYMRAEDYKYEYETDFAGKFISLEQFQDTLCDVKADLGIIQSKYGVIEDNFAENFQDAVIKETCERLGISYNRRKRNG